jgi:hypothetical protein
MVKPKVHALLSWRVLLHLVFLASAFFFAFPDLTYADTTVASDTRQHEHRVE